MRPPSARQTFHRGFAGGEFLLDLSAFIAADASEVFAGVIEFVGVKLELRFSDVEVISTRSIDAFCGRCKCVDLGLIVLHDGLQVGELLLQLSGFTGECSSVERGLSKCLSKGLVHFVIGKALRFACKAFLLRRDCQRSQGFYGLPGALVDEICAGAAADLASLTAEEGKVRHGTACEVNPDQACDKKEGRNSDGESAQRLLALHPTSFDG